jgi:hypothetical protein
MLYKTKSSAIESPLTYQSIEANGTFSKWIFTHVCAGISSWDQSEWLESVCVLEIVRKVLRSRLIAEKKLIVRGRGIAFGWSKEFE